MGPRWITDAACGSARRLPAAAGAGALARLAVSAAAALVAVALVPSGVAAAREPRFGPPATILGAPAGARVLEPVNLGAAVVSTGPAVFDLSEGRPGALVDVGVGSDLISIAELGTAPDHVYVVGDAAHDEVSVVRPGPGADRVLQRVPVAGDPVALARVGSDIVYGTASGEVGLLLARGTSLVAGPRQVVGEAVVAVLAENVIGDPASEVIVVSRAPDAVVVLENGGAGALRPVARVPLPAPPTDVTVTARGEALVIAIGRPEFIVVSADLRRGPAALGRVALPPGVVATDVAAGGLDREEPTDLVVADRALGVVMPLFGKQSNGLQRTGGYRAGAAVGLGRPLTGLAAIDAAGDDLWDAVVGDPARGGVTVLPLFGDEPLVLEHDAGAVAAEAGILVWDRQLDPDQHGLVLRSGGRAARIGGRSEREIDADIGRDRARHLIVTYARCARRRCAPYAWSASGGERRASLPGAAGCSIEQFARWHGAFAYRTGPRRPRCRRDPGTWIAWPGRAPRRLGGRKSRLGDLDSRRVAWTDVARRSVDLYRGRVVLTPRRGRDRVLDTVLSVDPPDLPGPDFDAAAVYWWAGSSGLESNDCTLARLTARGRRQPRLIHGLGLCAGWQGSSHFAVDRGALFHPGIRGIFRADAAAWRRCSRLTDGCDNPELALG